MSRIEEDTDRLSIWRDVLATTNGAKVKSQDVTKRRLSWSVASPMGGTSVCRLLTIAFTETEVYLVYLPRVLGGLLKGSFPGPTF
jgi:hypothetical protein